jgi:hypothetical protein
MKDSIISMTSKFRVQKEDGELVLVNLSTGKKLIIDEDKVYLEFESNSRVGAMINSYDRTYAQELFN